MTDVAQVRTWMEQAGCRFIRESGDNLVSTCPFHHVRSGTQFALNYKTGLYVCYSGACGASGNIYSFLVSGLHWSKTKAKWASEDFADGVDTREDKDLELPEWEKRHERVAEETLPEWMLGLYDFTPKYMLTRGFSAETIAAWEIGYDRKHKRVTFPVRDVSGKLMGFSKRATRKGQTPPYLHLGFKKSRILYGEYRVDATQPLWVVEGQADVLSLWQLGERNVVATMGTRVSDKQLSRLQEYNTVILALDNDRDGYATALRLGDELLESGQAGILFADWKRVCVKDPGELLTDPSGVRKLQEVKRRLVSYDKWRLT